MTMKLFEYAILHHPKVTKDAMGNETQGPDKLLNGGRRVLHYGGYLGMLHTYYPSFHRKQWKLVGLIAVVTGFQRATRIFSIFQKPMQMELL